MEDLIGEIMKERQLLEQERHDASALRLRVQRDEQELRAELAKLKAKREELLKEARAEARSLVRETRREMENLLRSLQETADQSARSRIANQARAAMQERLAELEEPLLPGDGEYQGELEVGMRVRVAGLGQEGEIVDLNADQALVQSGSIRIWVERGKLTPLAEQKKKNRHRAESRWGRSVRKKAKTISPELDLRGLTVEEALHVTDKYLDEALLAGLPWVRLIHGKGTGTLRAAIADYVKKHPRVSKHRWGRK